MTLRSILVVSFLILFPFSSARVIPLPPGVQPEGVTFALGSNYFASDLRSGSVYLIDIHSGLVTTAVPSVQGRIGVGLDFSRGRLFVAGGGALFDGGPKPALHVYDVATGKTIATCRIRNGGFVNDVVADRDFAYYTDSFRGVVYKLSISALPKCKFQRIRLPRPAFKAEDFVFKANGIVKYKNGIIVGNSALSAPFFIDLLNGNKGQQILSTGSIPGTDGFDIVRKKGGSILYVTQNRLQLISQWKLGIDDRKVFARALKNITAPEVFDFPTTVAINGDTLVVANARFDEVPPSDPESGKAVFSVGSVRI